MFIKLVVILFLLSYSLGAKNLRDNNVTDLNITNNNITDFNATDRNITSINIKDNNTTDLNITKKSEIFSYINIYSSIKNTKIYLDNNFTGMTPIELYKISANKYVKLKATADKRYYPKDFITNIYVKEFASSTYQIELKKGKAKVLLLGQDGYLFINEAFDRTLNSNNRIIEVEANKNVQIMIKNQDKIFSIVKDIHANKFYKLKYKLKPYRLNTKVKIIGNLMWQDDVDSKNKTLYYEKAKKYCEDLELAKYNDWYLPAIKQLDNLYKDKKIFRNGFGTKFYWSSSPKSGKSNIWSYSQAKNFDDDTIQNKITDFYNGNVRCVRKIKNKK